MHFTPVVTPGHRETKVMGTVQRGASTGKSPKRRKDFPLFVHQTGGGTWCKKVRAIKDGVRQPPKFFYFGSQASDPLGEEALKWWLRDRDDLLAGREPRRSENTTDTVAYLCNHFLTHKKQLLDSGNWRRGLSIATSRRLLSSRARWAKKHRSTLCVPTISSTCGAS